MSDDHTHSPEPESSSLAGYAAIKYTAILIIVLAILAFLACTSSRPSTEPPDHRGPADGQVPKFEMSVRG